MTADEVDEVDELAGCEAWLREAQRRVDEGVVEVARRMADRDEAERAARARRAAT